MKTPRRRLLVVGASAYQHYMYSTARRLGLEIFSVDGDPRAPMFDMADRHAVIDFSDTQAVVDYARDNGIQAVATINIDQGMNSVCAIQRSIGQTHLDAGAVLAATRKDLMRAAWERLGLSQPRFWVFSQDDRADILELVRGCGANLIVKPVDNSAKRGVSVLSEDRKSAEACIDEAFRASKAGKVIVEELVEGDLVFVATYIRDGGSYASLMKQSFTENLVQVRFDAPFSKGDSINTAAIQEAAEAAMAFGNGPFHTEIIISRSGTPFLVETSPRVSYATIALSRLVDGFDPVTQILSEAFEEDFPAEDHERGDYASLVHLEPKAGTARQAVPRDWGKDRAGLYEVVPVVPVGHTVRPFRTNVDRVMYFVVYGATPYSVDELSRQVSHELLSCCFV